MNSERWTEIYTQVYCTQATNI